MHPVPSPVRVYCWTMGGVRSFRIESKRFDLIREGDGIDSVSLFESGRFTRHSVFMGKDRARWLGKCIEENVVRETEQAFVRTFRESDKGYVIRQFTNKNGCYLELIDYGRGGCKGRLAIPEGQKQSGWRGFNKELQLLLNPIPVDNKERKNHYRQGIPVDEKIPKRIPAKEWLGPAVSYAESLQVPATPQDTHGMPPISHNPNSKVLKTPEITHTKVIVTEDEEGKVKGQEKFLGSIPYRRIGADITAYPKLTISLGTDGKRIVKWGGPVNQAQLASTRDRGHGMGQELKKPNLLVRVGHKDMFSGPSHFERGESSKTTHKPTQVWVPKLGGAEVLHGGPQLENNLALNISAENDVVHIVDALAVSRASSLGLTPIASITQESNSLMLRTSSVGDIRCIRVEYYVGINLSVPRNLGGYWPEEAATLVFMGESNMVQVEIVKGALPKESHCLAVVPRDIFREGSLEESLLDISPLNSYRGESIPSDQSEWVRQNMEVFSK